VCRVTCKFSRYACAVIVICVIIICVFIIKCVCLCENVLSAMCMDEYIRMCMYILCVYEYVCDECMCTCISVYLCVSYVCLVACLQRLQTLSYNPNSIMGDSNLYPL